MSSEPHRPPNFTLYRSFPFILQIVICRHRQRVRITVRKFRMGTALDILYFRTLSACHTHSRSSRRQYLPNFRIILSTIIRELNGEFCIFHNFILMTFYTAIKKTNVVNANVVIALYFVEEIFDFISRYSLSTSSITKELDYNILFENAADLSVAIP